MKILHVVPYYLPAWRYGGPIFAVHGLCKELVRLGHDVHVFTTNADGDGTLAVPIGTAVEIDGVKVWYFGVSWKRLFRAPGLKKAMNERLASFDVVHIHTCFNWPSMIAARLARRHNTPYILSPRGMLIHDLILRKSRWVKTAWLRLFVRNDVARASVVHFTSRLEADEARKLALPTTSFSIIENGLVSDELVKTTGGRGLALAELAHCNFLLFIGRINWKKGLDRLIKALPLIPGCHVLVAGNDEDDYQPELENLATQLGVRERIVFAGPVYGADKKTLLERASAFVLTSYSENFGNAVLEAMAVGCPVIVTPEVGVAELVGETSAGIVVDGDPEILARGINHLLAQPALRKSMGERGRAAVSARYTWKVLAPSIAGLYEQAVR
jgi:glycosyltransferase involved in cell wall biosynthesis